MSLEIFEGSAGKYLSGGKQSKPLFFCFLFQEV